MAHLNVLLAFFCALAPLQLPPQGGELSFLLIPDSINLRNY